MKKYLSIFLSVLIILGTGFAIAQTLKPYAFPFIGKWQPSEDPLLIDDYGFQDIQNLRKSEKGLKGVSGHTKINSSLIQDGQDYTEYTEVDTAAKISETATIISVSSVDHDDETYLYYDFGSDYFDGNFTHTFDFTYTANSGSVYVGLWGMANHVSDFFGFAGLDSYCIYLTTDVLFLSYRDGGIHLSSNTGAVTAGTTYYMKVVRDESVGTYGTLTVYIYTDADHTVLWDTLGPITMTERQNFRYLYGIIGYGHPVGTTHEWTGEIRNLAIDSAYHYPANGFHFKKDSPSESHVILVAYDSSDSASKLYQNTTAIPGTGDFSTTVLHTNATSANLGRFSNAPQGNMVYCNGEEAMIWGGDELRCYAFITSTDSNLSTDLSITAPRIYTEKVQNTLQTNDEVAIIGGGDDTYSKLILSCDSADGATSFTDDSDSAHTITANGDAQADTDQTKFGNSSGLFDGTGDYLSAADHADWYFSTGKFTIDTYIRFNAATNKQCIYSQATGPDYVALWQDFDQGKVYFAVMSAGSWLILQSVSWSPSINTWYHFAIIRGWGGNANDYALVVDGSSIGTFTDANALPDLAASIYIGSIANNVDIDFVDTGHCFTFDNTAVVSATLKKWGNGSLFLDGDSDYIYASDSTDWDIVADTSEDWTIDFWVRHNDHAGVEGYISEYKDVNNFWRLRHEHGVGIRFGVLSGGAWIIPEFGSGEITDNDWHHVAVVKKTSAGPTVEWGIYLDGVQTGYASDTSTVTITSDYLIIGSSRKGTEWLDGYMDEVRIIKSNIFNASPNVGETDTITVPTSAHTSDSDTKLLLHFDIMGFNGWIDEFRVSKGIARWETTFTPYIRAYSDDAPYWLVGSTRPLQGVKFYISNANTSTGTLTAKEWNGASWSDLTITDNTSGLTTTGTVTWASTEDTSKPVYLQGELLYWYQFRISAGGADIYYVTLDAPFQDIGNLWSGDEEVVASCRKYNATTYIDYTDYVNDNTVSTVAVLDALGTTHYLYLGFVYPQQGFNIRFPAGEENSNAATLTVSYWDGDAWQAVQNLNDGTFEGTDSFGKSGVITFIRPSKGTEFKKALLESEVPLYYYRLNFSATLDASVDIYSITGIASTYELNGYKFSELFQGRTFLFSEKSKDKNKAIYSAFNAPDVFNGDDSSYLYYGNDEELTAACVIYNVYRTTGYEQLLVTKKNETWRTFGDGPENWETQQISGNIGCIAPLSMKVCEVTGISEDIQHHVAIWQAAHGVVMCDGATIQTISDDVRCYWDPNDSRYIPANRQDDSVGFYDPKLRVYKLLISSGSGQATHNVELEYSLKYKEWTKIYREDASGARPLQCGFQVKDTDGNVYTYGAADDGYMYRLENGKTWDSVEPINQYVWTKDLLMDKEKPFFKHSAVNYMRLIFNEKSTGDGEDIDIAHYCNGIITTHGSYDQAVPEDIDMDDSDGINTQDCFLGPCLHHSFLLTADMSTVYDGMELTGLGLYYEDYDAIIQ